MTVLLSRFTPSVMPAETLEGIFIGREHILDAVMRRIKDAANSDTRNHTLLVGPRGAGKTHLIALAYHRTKALIATGLPLQLAWLPEDPWTIASYRHLLGVIAERLETDPSRAPRGTEAELEARLVAHAEDHGTIVVLVENLDRVLTQLGDTGQQKLRHFLQHECRMLLVATSTTLDRNLADQARPFYGFFTSTRLRPFTAEEGRDMLAAIAARAGNQELVEFLHTDRGLGRVKAIAHLAGGQPRLWALLSSSLDVRELDSLVDLLLTRFDDLTPYYQEQLAAISPQQRLIVAELAEANHPLHVGALATRLEIDQRSLAKSVSDLVDRAWLRAVTTPFADLLDRRRTYYELAEPMARLAFQLKDSRGEPLRLVVDFIKSWFDPDDLGRIDREGALGSYLPILRQEFESDAVGGVVRRLTSLPITRAPALDLLGRLDDTLAATMDGDASDLMELPTNLRVVLEGRLEAKNDQTTEMIDLRCTMHDEALEEVGDVPTKATNRWIRRAERLLTAQPDDGHLRLILIRWLAQAWRFPEAEAALEALFPRTGDDELHRLLATGWLAAAYQNAGSLNQAIPLLEQNLTDTERIFGPQHPDALRSRNDLAYAYRSAGDFTRAIPMLEQNLIAYERILGPSHPDTFSSRDNLANTYDSVGNLARAIALHEENIAYRERVLGFDHPHTLYSHNNLAVSRGAAGDAAGAVAAFAELLPIYERVLGAEHPDTLTIRNNLASYLGETGDAAGAATAFAELLPIYERVLGAEHPDTLRARNNLASWRGEAGDATGAATTFAELLPIYERVLGAEHPRTQIARNNLARWRRQVRDTGGAA